LAPAWIRFGLPGGIVAFAVTLTANLVILILRPADLCRFGPGIIPLSMLAALGAFLLLAAVAGFLTGRASGAVAEAVLTGLLVGAISGCALVALIPFLRSVNHRIEALTARCPQSSSFTDSGSFSFSRGPTPPPGFTAPTPPPGPGVTPPPGFLSAPPPGFSPPSGAAGIILRAVGLIFTIGVGMGLATGVAALAGLAGAATKPSR